MSILGFSQLVPFLLVVPPFPSNLKMASKSRRSLSKQDTPIPQLCWSLKQDTLIAYEELQSVFSASERVASINSLPEFMNFGLFGKTILVANKKFGLFWAIHSAGESKAGPPPAAGTEPQPRSAWTSRPSMLCSPLSPAPPPQSRRRPWRSAWRRAWRRTRPPSPGDPAGCRLRGGGGGEGGPGGLGEGRARFWLLLGE